MAEITITYTAEITNVLKFPATGLDRAVETIMAPLFAETQEQILKNALDCDDVDVRDLKVFITKEEDT